MSDFQAPQTQQNGQMNGLAIASMVVGIVWIYWIGSILAVIFGHVALNQMKKNPTMKGKGFAIAGVALGWTGVGILALLLVFAGGLSLFGSSY